MQYCSSLYAVRSIKTAVDFYVSHLNQKPVLDAGTHVAFESGLALQEDFSGLAGFPEQNIQYRSHDGELYFETEDLEADTARLQKAGVEFLHGIKEYPWGQHVSRFFDPDGHIIELAESMCSVVLHFLDQGLTDEETAKRTQHPLQFVQWCKTQRK